MNRVSLKSVIAETINDLYKSDRELRKKSALHVKAAVKAKINKIGSEPGGPPGKVTGELIKALSVSSRRTVALVGVKAPGYHANILEFGHEDRTARPFLFPTFAEESHTVMRILGNERL